MKPKLILAACGLLIATLPGLATGADKPAKWTDYADCAGAYRANAALKDPSRTASMISMISDVADDYEKAALKARPRGKAESDEAAAKAVKTRVLDQAARFGRQPREAVEHFIDACPQTGDP